MSKYFPTVSEIMQWFEGDRLRAIRDYRYRTGAGLQMASATFRYHSAMLLVPRPQA